VQRTGIVPPSATIHSSGCRVCRRIHASHNANATGRSHVGVMTLMRITRFGRQLLRSGAPGRRAPTPTLNKSSLRSFVGPLYSRTRVQLLTR